jgi:spore germination protein
MVVERGFMRGPKGLVLVALLLGSLLTGLTLPPRGSVPVPHLAGFVVPWDPLSARTLEAHPRAYAAVYYDVAAVTRSGAVVMTPAPLPLVTAGVANFLTVSNIWPTVSESAILTTLWQHPRRAHRLAEKLAALVRGTTWWGLNLDFEGNPFRDRRAFTRFVVQLANVLHREGKALTLDVPAETAASAHRSGYSYTALGHAADALLIMAYDVHNPDTGPGPIAPQGWVRQVVAYASRTVPADKLWLGLPFYGYLWAGRHVTALTLGMISTWLSTHSYPVRWDRQAATPFVTYVVGRTRHWLYFESPRSLAAVECVAARHHWAGVFYWFIGSGTPAAFRAVARYPESCS